MLSASRLRRCEGESRSACNAALLVISLPQAKLFLLLHSRVVRGLGIQENSELACDNSAKYAAFCAAALAAAAGILVFQIIKKAGGRPRPCLIEPHCWSNLLPPTSSRSRLGAVLGYLAFRLLTKFTLKRACNRFVTK